jgi:ABC-type Mn2+/Zn2+ transport system ATPase subunit
MGREAQRGILRPLGDGDRQAVQAALVRCGVFDLKDRPVDELSGGQFQRVLLARALAPNPELLIMDEPSAHLDAASRKGILDVIADLSGKAGLLIVSHDRELLSLCSRFIHFEAGRAGEVKSPLGGDDA